MEIPSLYAHRILLDEKVYLSDRIAMQSFPSLPLLPLLLFSFLLLARICAIPIRGTGIM